MKIWLFKEGEMIPGDCENVRLFRTGLLAKELAQREHEVIWWTSTFNHSEKKIRYNKDNTIVVNPNYKLKLLHSIGYKKNICLKRLLHQNITARKFLRIAKKEEKPDILVAAMPTIDLAKAAIKYGNKNDIPVLIDVRDLWPDIFCDYFHGFKQKALRFGIIPLKHTLGMALQKAVGIIGTSEPFLDWGLNYAGRVRNKNDNVFYVSYPQTKETNLDQEIRNWEEFGVRKKDFVCCFFGQFGYSVDIETVIDAALICENKNLDIKFVICGTGEKLALYKKLANKNKNIIFPGWIDKKMITALGTISDVGLMAYKPSKNYEMSMPNKFCEYLSMRTAIMLQPTGLMRTFVQENVCGMAYETAKDLANNLEKLYKEPEELEKMKINAYNLYVKKFCAEKVYSCYADHIEYVAKKYMKGNKTK